VLRERAKPKVVGRVRKGGRTITLVEDERTKRKKKQRKRPRKYDKEVVVALLKVWVICDCICGKRLRPYLPEIIPVLERLDEGSWGLPLYFTGDGPHEVAGLDLLHGAGIPLSSRMST